MEFSHSALMTQGLSKARINEVRFGEEKNRELTVSVRRVLGALSQQLQGTLE